MAHYYNTPSVYADGHLMSPPRGAVTRATRQERAARLYAEVKRAELAHERATIRLHSAQRAHEAAVREIDAPLPTPDDTAKARRDAASARTKAYRNRKRQARAGADARERAALAASII